MEKILKIGLIGTLVGLSFGMIFGYVPVQVKLFKDAVQNSAKIINCANCDFRGVQEFAGLDAHGAYMPGVTFQPCVQTKLNQDNELMVCVENQASNLTGANFAHATFFSSCFDNAILDKADLSGADFTNSSIQNASLKDAKVTGVITKNACFCNTVMPDGVVCNDTWTGQGVTIACNCPEIKQDTKSAPKS